MLVSRVQRVPLVTEDFRAKTGFLEGQVFQVEKESVV